MPLLDASFDKQQPGMRHYLKLASSGQLTASESSVPPPLSGKRSNVPTYLSVGVEVARRLSPVLLQLIGIGAKPLVLVHAHPVGDVEVTGVEPGLARGEHALDELLLAAREVTNVVAVTAQVLQTNRWAQNPRTEACAQGMWQGRLAKRIERKFNQANTVWRQMPRALYSNREMKQQETQPHKHDKDQNNVTNFIMEK
jgi:hypothetical protein